MSNNRSNFFIAFIVVACSVLLLLALTAALTDIRIMPGPERQLQIDFPSVTGIKIHTPVRYAGAQIGFVSKIRPLTFKERKENPNPQNTVRVTVTVDENMPPLTKEVSTTIESDTVLAEKFLNFDPGSPEVDLLPEGTVIQGRSVASFDSLTAEGLAVISTLKEMIEEIRRENPELPHRVSSIVTNSDELVKRATSLTKHLEKIIGDNEEKLDKSVKDLKVIADNLKVVTSNAKALTRTLAEKPWRVMWGGDVVEPPSEEDVLKSDKPIPLDDRSIRKKNKKDN